MVTIIDATDIYVKKTSSEMIRWKKKFGYTQKMTLT